MRVARSDEEMMARRRAALVRLERGEQPAAVAQALGCSRSSVYRWRDMACEHGGVVPPPRRSPGRPSQFANVRGSLQARLSDSPRRRHIDAPHWTTELVREEIRKLTQTSYKPSTVEKILRALGWRSVASGKHGGRHWELKPGVVNQHPVATPPTKERRR